MILIGLTGGIGSGKSTVSSLLAKRGAVIIDADAITRELQQPGEPLLSVLAERFGAHILAADGSLIREELRNIAFSDPEALKDLNKIVHPAVAKEMDRRISRLAEFRGLMEEDARAIIAKQASREDRAKIADKVIDNSGDLDSLSSQVDAVWGWALQLPRAAEDAGSREDKTSSNKDS